MDENGEPTALLAVIEKPDDEEDEDSPGVQITGDTDESGVEV
jgi:hypothetical protein